MVYYASNYMNICAFREILLRAGMAMREVLTLYGYS
jgi:hypothetical protein